MPDAIGRLLAEPVPASVSIGSRPVLLAPSPSGASGALDGVKVDVLLERGPSALQLHTIVTNTGTSTVEDVRLTPLDLRLDLSTETRLPRIRHLSGSWHYDAVYPPRAFRSSEEAFVTHDHARRVKLGGINAGIHSPILQFALGSPMEIGVFAGLEWSGGWRIEAGWMELSFHGEPRPAFRIFAVAETEVSRLHPGDSISLPIVHLGGGAVADWDELSDIQRRHMRSLRPSSSLPVFPVSYDSWFGRYEDFDLTTLLADAERAAEIGVEVFCLDACWYRSEHVHSGLGNWFTPDPRRFPRGSDDVRRLADRVRGLGMTFGLWHLIQLAAPDTDVVRERPELFRPATPSDGRARLLGDFGRLDEPEMTAFNGLVLALERDEAVEYALEILERWIADWGVGWFRFESVPFDGLAYNEGYNRVIDELRSRHPALYIEACNGGGQRLDLNSVRRTHGNWLSDHTSASEVTRFNQTGALRFWPAHMLNMAVTAFAGSADRQATIYEVMSRMVGPLSFNGALAEWSPEATTTVRRAVDVYKRVRDLLDGDVAFPLPQPRAVEDWDAVLFRRDGRTALFVARFEGSSEQFIPLAGSAALQLLLASETGVSATSAVGGVRMNLPRRSAALWVTDESG